jgi:hypothetical protein
MTYSEELTFIEAAIQKIITNGQAVSIDGSSLSRANLSELYKRQTDLLTLINLQHRGGRFRAYGGVTI